MGLTQISFLGINGSIDLTFLREGIYRVEYQFASLPTAPSPDRIPESSIVDYHLEEREKHFTITIGFDSILLQKEDGLISLYHKKKLVHGGVIGSSDTVLPRYPLRIFSENGQFSKARLNFRLEDGDRFFGLGDKSGALNKRGRHFQMHNRDALGYDAEIADPLYKSIPFLMKQGRDRSQFCGLYLESECPGTIDLGRESQLFYYWELKSLPFRYTVFTGDSAWDIIEKYTWVTGRPSLPPLYTFGFLGSSMNYTEPVDADMRVTRYFDKIEELGIPCEGFYFSSGYIKADNSERYTFEWNKNKFPDPEKSMKNYADRGYHIACNIKPGFLVTHPKYSYLSDQGYFIKGQDGHPYVEYYWGKNASFIDFTNPEALQWWKKQLKEKFIDYGVSGIWNDNNELELEDEGLDAQRIRSQYPVQMAKASWESFLEAYPGKRPWIISRSGGAGIQKYARTWSGDNTSSWIALKYNNFMGLGLGLSGIPYYGHDIGGFFGDPPDEKQFIRWCQSAVFQPRFVIHSWNADGNPTELWSYPDVQESLIELVQLHYEFMPIIYNAAIHAAATGKPIERPLALAFPEDERIDSESPHYMFGDDILVISALEADKERFECYLPKGQRWWDPQTGCFHEGGEAVEVEYPYKGTRYFVRAGSVAVTAPGLRKLDTGYFPSLKFEIIPGGAGVYKISYYEDDGSSLWQAGNYAEYQITHDSDTMNFGIQNIAIPESAVPGKREIIFSLPGGWVFDLPGNPAEYHTDSLPLELKLEYKKL